MTQDDIIRMAQEADAATRFPVAQIPIERLIPFLEHFAALVISAAPAPAAQSDHETWRAKLWELIDGYRKGHDWPLAMRDRIKAHIAKMPAAPTPVLTPAQQHADELLQALTHLHHNARASGAEMGLALDVAGALLAKVKATGQESGV